MIVNRLREWRERRGLSLDLLCERVGASRTTIHRLETQPGQAIHPLVEKIAAELGVRFSDLFSDPPDDGLPLSGGDESAVPFSPPAGHILANARISSDRKLFQLLDESLSEIGLYRGDVVVAELHADVLAIAQSGAAVIGRLSSSSDDVFVHRQFVAPQLLVTNGSITGAPNLHVTRDAVQVIGLIKDRFGATRR